jgi:hypothetical protein
MTNYDVRLTSQDRFTVDLNYEVPFKQIQYSNIILDDISAQFDGNVTNFTLYANGEEYFPVNEQQLVVSLNGVLLTPVVDYQISGNIITFLSPPTAGQSYSAVALATAADATRNIVFMIDNGSINITPGDKGYLPLDIGGKIETWSILSDQTGSIAIDIEKTTYDDFPSNFTSIVGSEFPKLINENKNKDIELTTWTPVINTSDVLKFSVLSCSGISRCTVVLKMKV